MALSCTCDAPREHSNPRRAGWCANCLKRLDPRWLSTDKTVREFFNRLESALPGYPDTVPDSFHRFRSHCEARELAGRESFGLSYLTRDNPREAMQEAADGGIYALLDVLANRRSSGADEDPDIDLALTAALHAYRAHECFEHLAAKRHGSP